MDKNVNLRNVSPGHIFCRAFRRLTNRERLTLAGHLEGRLVCCLEEGEGEKRSQWDWKLLSTWTGLGRVTQLVVVDHGRDHTTRIDRSLRRLCRYLNVLNTRTTSRSRVSRSIHTLVHFGPCFFCSRYSPMFGARKDHRFWSDPVMVLRFQISDKRQSAAGLHKVTCLQGAH